jgi:decaprenylphospho-beta-D-erythro-pentofuranosid-2-ulose 2-reductase
MSKKIVIIGGSSCIAENCAKLWAKSIKPNFILLGRNQEKLEHVKKMLQAECKSSLVDVICLNFNDPNEIQQTIDDIFKKGKVDIALVAHGDLPNQEECQKNLQLNLQALIINGISPVLFAEAIACNMERINYGSIGIIGSVSGDRGRKSNYVYGSAKGLISRYTQGLQHRLAKSKVSISLIKPGPTDTPMTAQHKKKGRKMSNAIVVSKIIVNGIERKQKIIYAPRRWRYIMLIIAHLPRYIINKLHI